jgi:ribose-phosphate pyrophosphokinase
VIGEDISVVLCESGIPFGQKLISELEKLALSPKQVNYNLINFANTEFIPELLDSVRGDHVFVVADCDNHSNGRSTADNFSELTQTISAAKLVGAEKITAILPFLPYSRQDKQNARQPITCALKIRELENSGRPALREILSFDLHNKAITGFSIEIPLIPLYASKALIPKIKNQEGFDPKNSVFIGPDLGRGPLANFYSQQLDSGIALIYKSRDYSNPNECESFQLLGNVKKKDVYILDDMIDTGGTIIGAICEISKEDPNSIIVVHTHSLFNKKIGKNRAIERDPIEEFRRLYNEGIIKKIIGTDTIYNERLLKEDFYEQVSVAPLCAEISYRIHKGESISNLLK